MKQVTLALVVVLTGCGEPRTDFGEKFYSRPGHRVLCSKGADRDHVWKLDTLQKSLDVAKAEGIVLQTYGHAPSSDNAGVNIDEFMASFDYAYASGIPTVTFKQIADGYDGPGWSFSIDDYQIETWTSWRPMLAAHHAKLTFFVSNIDQFSDAQKQLLRELAADGHDIEAHSLNHLNAKIAVADGGYPAYFDKEIKPSIDLLTVAGFPPVAFAYPYGAHTPEIDAKLEEHFKVLRTTGSSNCY